MSKMQTIDKFFKPKSTSHPIPTPLPASTPVSIPISPVIPTPLPVASDSHSHPNSTELMSPSSPTGNQKMTSPDIQRDLTSSSVFLTSKAIAHDIGESFFTLLVDEARDSLIKEQMAITLRYVNKKGYVIERFIGVVHASDTTSQSLKRAIDDFLTSIGLSMTCCRGQSYDGASNMRGSFKGLKSLILHEHPSAFYIHCFAHQLQLALNATAKNIEHLEFFFGCINELCNIVCISAKRKDILLVNQHEKMIQGINCGEIEIGRGFNQETTLRRRGETRWGSHYQTVISVISLYPSILELLEAICEDVGSAESRCDASIIREHLVKYEFIFVVHLMKHVIGYTFELSQALQRKDQHLVNAISFVNLSKKRLQNLRDEGWEKLLNEVDSFANKYSITIPQMEEMFVYPMAKRRRAQPITNLHYYQVEIFYSVIDSQLQELNDRFDNVNIQLLECIACLDPRDRFASFDKGKLVNFARFYPMEFDEVFDLDPLENQLEIFWEDMKSNTDFHNLNGITELAIRMVEKGKDRCYPLVFLVVKLALILPVATATVEGAFSAMKIIKNDLRNRMGDDFLNDAMLCYIQKDVFDSIEDKDIMLQFLNMKNKKSSLPKKFLEKRRRE